MAKSLPAMQETWVWSLGQEDPLEQGMATSSNILDWEIPQTEKPGGLQSMGLQRVGHEWWTNTFTKAGEYTPISKNLQLLLFMEGKIEKWKRIIPFTIASKNSPNIGSWWWTGRPGVLRFMGRKESDPTEWLNWAELNWISGNAWLPF